MKVENVYTYTGTKESATFIGRPSPLGNPYKIGYDGSREEVIEKYRRWLQDAISVEGPIKDAFESLRDLDVLLCYCAPLSCHGDVLIEDLNI